MLRPPSRHSACDFTCEAAAVRFGPGEGACPIDVSLAARAASGVEQRPLRDDTVQVWLHPLDLPSRVVERLWTLLSPDECARAARFHAETHRRRFVVRRARLRELLAPYAGCAPGEVELEEPPGRRPRFRSGAYVAFSVSHSNELAVFPFGTREIGVDLERIEPAVDINGLTRSFAARERTAISCARRGRPARQRHRRARRRGS